MRSHIHMFHPMHNHLSEIYEAYKNHSSVKMIKGKTENLGTEEEFYFRPVTEDQLYKKCIALKTNKPCGYDNQPACLIKAVTNVVRHTLLPIVNNYFVNSVFPTDLKFADVTHVCKKEDSLFKKPVSGLVCQSKLFEKIMSDHIMEHFTDKLVPYLFAYREGYSTQHVLIRTIET